MRISIVVLLLIVFCYAELLMPRVIPGWIMLLVAASALMLAVGDMIWWAWNMAGGPDDE